MITHQLVQHKGLRMVLPNLAVYAGDGTLFTPPDQALSACYCGYDLLLWWETEEEPGGGWCPRCHRSRRQQFLALTGGQPTKGERHAPPPATRLSPLR